MARISPLVIAPPLIFLALAVLFFVGMQREDPEALPSRLAGRPAPVTELAPLAGFPGFTDADLRDGRVKLVNFWASWCAPCRAEHPNLAALSEEGIPIYGINYKDSESNAAGFLRELGNPFAGIGVDPNGRNAIEWGVYGVPETFVLAGDGTVVLRFAGPLTRRVIAERIRPALAEAAER